MMIQKAKDYNPLIHPQVLRENSNVESAWGQLLLC